MKNFLGRILILVTSTVNIVLSIVMISILSFYLWSNTENFLSSMTGANCPVNIFEFSLHIFTILFFIYVTIWCLKNIAKGKSMKNALIGTSVLLGVIILNFCTHLFVPNVFIFSLSAFISTSVTQIVTTSLLIIGCYFNFYRDCR